MGVPKSKTCCEVCFLAKQTATARLRGQKTDPASGSLRVAFSDTRAFLKRRSSSVVSQARNTKGQENARGLCECRLGPCGEHSGPPAAAQSPRSGRRAQRGQPAARRERVPREGPRCLPPADTEEKSERRCSQDKRHTRCGAGLSNSAHLVLSPSAGPRGRGAAHHTLHSSPATQNFRKNHVSPAPQAAP